ncbi:SUKH-4 family immunity protein [Streptomyces sp. WZ-12]|uniref:SUKH-4 family immunity protein n=1 Tax=Streptomyces sp. WZ-12 TaxID=3030210 RepID=UPI002380DA31|nr:SUKH-4 family immunity protein [Streptomyces sp. WZ-12]
MTEMPPEIPLRSPEQAVAQVLDWWENGRDDAGRVNLAVEQDGPAVSAVLRELHRRVPGSVLLDATGKTADGLLNELLDVLGVPESPRFPWNWDDQVKRLGTHHLVLIDHSSSAGPTRRSAQTELVVRRLAEQLSLADGLGAVLAVPLDHDQRLGSITLRLDTAPTGEDPDTPEPADLPFPVRALALSEPRLVPLPVWRELMTAATTAGLDASPDGTQPPAAEADLEALARQLPSLLHYADGLVSFADEGLAAAIRRAQDSDVTAAVGRHLVTWLRQHAPDFQHPDGWAASGPLGRYATDGILMHAVQAGLFDELVADGTVVAHLPQPTLLDAAHCAYDGSLLGNNAAADAVYLLMYALTRLPQPAWAAWLHLAATARGDIALADGITRSGIQLPWQTLWTHWRPPGGYHHSYLHPGAIGDLHPVRWEGRPAVLSDGDDGTHIWDPTSGELLAGPWTTDEDFPTDARPALTWHSGDHTVPGPTSLQDLREHADTSEVWVGALEGPLYVSLTIEPAGAATRLIVVAGDSGLFAVRPQPDVDPDDLHQPYVRQLLGALTAAGPTTPANAPAPSPQDLAAIFGADAYVTTAPERLPDDLTDPTARRVLTETGLPAFDDQGIALDPSAPDFLDEVSWAEGFPEEPDETGPFYRIGIWMGGDVVVDGPSGHVLRCPGYADDTIAEGGALVATDLEHFLTMAALFVTGRRILMSLDSRDEAHLLRQHIEDALFEVDWECSDAGAWVYPLHNE